MAPLAPTSPIVLVALFAALSTHGVAGAQTTAAPPDAALQLEENVQQVHAVEGELARVEQEVQRVARDDPNGVTLRAKHRELELHAARLRQSAIQQAIAAYEIDVRHLAFGVIYSPHGAMRDREGATYVDRDGVVRVEIGDEAFGSAGVLGSTIGHEVEVHVNAQILKGVHYPPADEQGTMIQEVEAYDYELSNQDRYRLSADEVKVLKQRRASFYRRLQWENRKRADDGVYSTW